MDNQQISTLAKIPISNGYFCDHEGNIYSSNRGKLRKLKPYLHKGKGKKFYQRICLKNGKHYLLHRLICAAKVGRDLLEEEEVNHLDANTLNNCWENIELSCRASNVEHAVCNNLYCSGEEWYLARGKIPTTIR
jgi:hypothetical protein